MSSLTTYLVSFILLFLSLPYGMEEPLKAPEYEFEWVKDLGEEIEKVAWGVSKDGALHPKMLVHEGGVRAYDKNGEVTRRLALSEYAVATLSPQGKYLGVADFVSLPPGDTGAAQWGFTLYDSELRERRKIEYPVDFNGDFRQFCLSDLDGIFAEVYDYERALRFHDVNRDFKKELRMFDKAEHSYLGTPCSFTKNGEFFAVLACHAYFDQDRSPHHDWYLMFFRKDGTELWRLLVEEGEAHMSIGKNSLTLSYEGRYALVATAVATSGVDRGLTLVDGNGTVIGKYRGWFGRFSDDERYLVICGRNVVRLAETQSGEVLWEIELPWTVSTLQQQWRRMTDADISEDGGLIAILSTGYRRYIDADGAGGLSEFGAETMLYSRTGDLLYRGTTEGGRRLRVSPNGTEVRLLTRTSTGTIRVFREGR